VRGKDEGRMLNEESGRVEDGRLRMEEGDGGRHDSSHVKSTTGE
jgi:hypothetical protein